MGENRNLPCRRNPSNFYRQSAITEVKFFKPELKSHSDFLPKSTYGDVPGGAVVKHPPANAGDAHSIPGPGRCHMPRSN